jgi:signal transduction histidine kinase
MPDDIEEKARQLMSVRTVILTSLISAFGFVLALFWNDAVRSAIEQIVPQGGTVSAKFAAAIIVTIIIAIIIYILVHSQRIAEKRLQELVKSRKPVVKKLQEIHRKREETKRKIIDGS